MDELQDKLSAKFNVSEQDQQNAAKLGRLFGFEISGMMGTILGMGFAKGIPIARRWGENKAPALGDWLAKQHGKPDKAGSYAGIIRDVIGYAIIAIPSVLNFAATVKSLSQSVTESGKKAEPILGLHGDSRPGLIGLLTHSWRSNTVFAPKRKQLLGAMKAHVSQDLISLANMLPNLYVKHKEKQIEKQYANLVTEINAEWKGNHSLQSQFGYKVDDYKHHRLTELIKEDHGDTAMTAYLKAREKLDTMDEWGGPIATAVTGTIQQNMHKNGTARLTNDTTLDLILQLQDQWRQSPNAESVGSTGASLSSLIEMVLTRHQQENGFKALPDRRRAEVASLLASSVEFGGLNIGSLAYLIGEGSLFKSVRAGELAADEQIETVIAAEMKKYKKVQTFDLDAYLKDGHFEMNDLKKIFEAAKENPQEMAFLASLFPAEVVMKSTGLGKKDVWKLMKSAGHQYYDEVAQAVTSLARISDKDLGAQGLNEKEIEAIRDFASSIREQGRHAISEMMHDGDKGKTVKTALATVIARQKTGEIKAAAAEEKQAASESPAMDYTNAFGDGQDMKKLLGPHTHRLGPRHHHHHGHGAKHAPKGLEDILSRGMRAPVEHAESPVDLGPGGTGL